MHIHNRVPIYTKIGHLAYSHDGTKIAYCGEEFEGIIVRDAESGELLNEISEIGHIHVYDITYSWDGKFLISGDKDFAVCVWDELEVHQEKNSGHMTWI